MKYYLTKMERDFERINRIVGLMDEHNLDYVIVFDPINLRYLAGSQVDYSSCILSRTGEIYLVVPPMEYERAKRITWVDRIYKYGEGEGPEWIRAGSLVEATAKLVEGRVGLPYSYISHIQYEKIKSFIDSNIDNCDNILKTARTIKTNRELSLINKAVRLVEDGIRHAIDILNEGITEKSIAKEIIVYFYGRGADKVYSDLIVASGYRSAFPHGRATDKVISSGDPVTLDFVAAYEGYWGDVTRTFFVRRVEPEIKKIYEVVEEALYRAIDKIEVGVNAKDVDGAAREYIEKSGYGKYFIHSTGHGIGLEVHEDPRLSSKSNDVLVENMVVTVEPGIYIKDVGGVRIENDVLVTEEGAKILNSLSTELMIL